MLRVILLILKYLIILYIFMILICLLTSLLRAFKDTAFKDLIKSIIKITCELNKILLIKNVDLFLI